MGVCREGGEIVAGFGLDDEHGPSGLSLSWMMVEPSRHGQGWGRRMMDDVLQLWQGSNALVLEISASHLSAEFFARCGAHELSREIDGWGPGMHRVDMELHRP